MIRFLPLLMVALLAACANKTPPPACPETGFLAGAAAAPVFASPLPAPDMPKLSKKKGKKKNLAAAPAPAPAVQDAKNVTLYAVLRNLRGTCAAGTGGRVVELAFDVAAQKTALGQGVETQKFSYFVAVLGPDDEVLQRELFYVIFNFGKSGFEEETVEHRVKIPASAAPGSRIAVGFTLDPEQADFNTANPHDAKL